MYKNHFYNADWEELVEFVEDTVWFCISFRYGKLVNQ